MKKLNQECFVCNAKLLPNQSKINQEINLWVCLNCSGTEKEKQKVKELLVSLAEGFVCGCI